MNSNSLISKLKKNRKYLIRTLGFTFLIRSVYGFAILGIAYFFDVTLEDIRGFEFLGLRLYFLILPLIALLAIRRFYKLYKWWTVDLENDTNE